MEEFTSQPSTSSQLHDESILSSTFSPLHAASIGEYNVLLDEYLRDDLEDNSGDAEPLPSVDLLSKPLSNEESLSSEDEFTLFGASVQDALLQQTG